MLEIISFVVLQNVIANMARRRDRTPGVFRIMLFLCWICGEFAGGGAGYLLARFMNSQNFVVWIGAGGLLGAVFGATTAFVWAKLQAPLNGEWRDLSEESPPKSRLAGALVGGVVGMLIGAGVVAFLFGNPISAVTLSGMIQGGLAVGFIGAFLGLVSGLEK